MTRTLMVKYHTRFTRLSDIQAVKKKILYGDSFPDDPNMQKQGANETYAKRTSLCLAFGIVADDDDDGQGASLLDAYKDKQDEIRTKTNNWLTAELAQMDKKKR